MFKNKITLSLISTVILAVWGCGTMAKDDDTLSVPQKVSIEMPKALKVEASKREKRVSLQKEDSKKSLAYLELKEDVKFLEEQRVNVEVNLLFINEVIADIDRRCKEVALEETCVIKEDSLTFVFDQNLSDKLTALTTEDLGYVLGDVLSYGKIEFVKHDALNKYAYTLKMDTSFEEDVGRSFQRISWSKDETLILAEYNEESSEIKSEIKIDFVNQDDNSKQIVVEDSWLNKVDKSSDTFGFDMLKKVDAIETYEVNSSSIAIDSDGITNSFSSVGKLSNVGGDLAFVGEFDAEVFKEYDTFDGEGNLLSSSYCYSDMACDLDNNATWLSE